MSAANEWKRLCMIAVTGGWGWKAGMNERIGGVTGHCPKYVQRAWNSIT